MFELPSIKKQKNKKKNKEWGKQIKDRQAKWMNGKKEDTNETMKDRQWENEVQTKQARKKPRKNRKKEGNEKVKEVFEKQMANRMGREWFEGKGRGKRIEIGKEKGRRMEENVN